MGSYLVQVSGHLPPHSLERDRSVRRQTVLRATVRDQAALYGFLKLLHDLGLDLVDFRQIEDTWTPGERQAGSPPDHNAASTSAPTSAPMTIEVVIRGSVGEIALSALCDHVEVTHLATRLVLSDRQVLGQVLEWARTAGVAVEYATDVPPQTHPPSTPPTTPAAAPSGSPVKDDVSTESTGQPESTHRDNGASTSIRRSPT